MSSDGEINSIEMDLLKSYVLKFYESLTSGETSAGTNVKAQTKKVEAVPVKATPEPVIEKPKPAAAPPAEPRGNAVSDTPKAKPATISREMKSLFEIEKGKEISDKLSISKINDIGKSMSINEKMFTITELFGGNQTDFDGVISKLNGLSSYQEAQTFLAENVVNQNSWLDESKVKKAKTFLKLVYRRYI